MTAAVAYSFGLGQQPPSDGELQEQPAGFGQPTVVTAAAGGAAPSGSSIRSSRSRRQTAMEGFCGLQRLGQTATAALDRSLRRRCNRNASRRREVVRRAAEAQAEKEAARCRRTPSSSIAEEGGDGRPRNTRMHCHFGAACEPAALMPRIGPARRSGVCASVLAAATRLQRVASQACAFGTAAASAASRTGA